MPSVDFHQLLAAARAGERSATERLIAELYPSVQSLVHTQLATDLRRKRPWLSAMFSTGDVVQEVFLNVIRGLDDFQGTHEAALVSYLATLVKNRLVDAVRFHEAMCRDVRRTPVRVEETEHLASGEEPGDLAAREEQLRLFTQVVSGLPMREQLLLRERLHGGQTFPQLATSLGYPSEDAARKAFHAVQARLLLRLRPITERSRDDG
ncbi:MAG: sigma-70 family RNA polymerase sigma factor [Planctomycetota bacterium]